VFERSEQAPISYVPAHSSHSGAPTALAS
jgi:hypothetical protein